LAVADFNGDGSADLAVTESATDSALLLFNACGADGSRKR
jgi:hypothetical protein